MSRDKTDTVNMTVVEGKGRDCWDSPEEAIAAAVALLEAGARTANKAWSTLNEARRVTATMGELKPNKREVVS